MLRALSQEPQRATALDRVAEWTRERFRLAPDAPVLVSEITCGLPGCPPRETVIAFWTEGERRHQFRIFKAVEEVSKDDLPPSWLRDSLIPLDGFECC